MYMKLYVGLLAQLARFWRLTPIHLDHVLNGDMVCTPETESWFQL